MITHEVTGQVDITGIEGITDMGMKMTGKAYGLMIDKLYTRKEDAVIRELGANARDAMKDLSIITGQPMKTFSIQLPNDICHELIIRDNGTGLSVENVQKYLGNLFESSKEKENTSIGAYGLGSKSPFAVTDSYTIESRFNGEVHHFSFFRAKGSVPQLVKISTMPTTEPNGITFRVPAPSSRYSTYKKAVAAQLFFFDPRPDVGAHKDLWDDYAVIKMEGSTWKFIESAGLKNYYGTVLANMGGVSYPVDINRLDEIDTEDDFITKLGVTDIKERAQQAKSNINRLINASGSNIVFGLFFDIGDLEVPPSRENLEYDAQTCYNIIVRIETLMEEITQKFIDMINERADPSNPEKLQKTLVEISNIINWDSSTNKSVGPSVFCEPIRALTWDINIADGLPTVRDANGKEVSGVYIVKNTSPSRMLSEVKQVFPHHLVDLESKEYVTSACDVNGVVNDKEEYDVTKDYILKKGYVLIKSEVKTVKALTVESYNLVETYLLKYQEWQPILVKSDSIAPINGRVTSNVEFNKKIKSWDFAKDSDAYGNKSGKDSIFILIDDPTKADFNSLTKYGTWALRRSAGGLDKRLSDVECLSLDPKRHRNAIYYLQGNKEGFEFFRLWNAKRAEPFILWNLSEMVIPKAPKIKDDTITVMRGVKYIQVTPKKALSASMENDKLLHQSSSFISIRAKDNVEPGFIVFGSGKDEKLYLDKELKVTVDTKTVLRMINLYLGLMGQKSINIYRLTPTSVKHIDTLLEDGFEVLYDKIQKSGTNNNVGSNQFKRRYKASMLTWAFHESDSFAQVKDKGVAGIYYEYVSSMMKFMKACKIPNPAAEKYIYRMNRSMARYASGKGIFYTKDIHGNESHAHCFGVGYLENYKKMASIEAWRLVIDSLYKYNLTAYTILLGSGRNYAYSVIENAIKNFRRDRREFLTDKYKDVLFGGFFDRGSNEFTNALKIAEKKLGYSKVDKQPDDAVQSVAVI